MPQKKKKAFQKSIKICLSRLKKMPSSFGHLSGASATPTSSSGRLFSSCKYPKTPSFAGNRAGDKAAATLSDVDRFLHENFRSLYRRGGNAGNDKFPSESERVFASKGSTQGSAGEDGRLSPRSDYSSPPQSPSPSGGAVAFPDGGVAVTTFSKEPYEDFRRSMKDMMDSRHAEPLQPLDWDFMEELLFCYLEINGRDVHKYILRAFTDLTVSFRLREEEGRRRVPARRKKFVPATAPATRRPFPAGR